MSACGVYALNSIAAEVLLEELLEQNRVYETRMRYCVKIIRERTNKVSKRSICNIQTLTWSKVQTHYGLETLVDEKDMAARTLSTEKEGDTAMAGVELPVPSIALVSEENVFEGNAANSTYSMSEYDPSELSEGGISDLPSTRASSPMDDLPEETSASTIAQANARLNVPLRHKRSHVSLFDSDEEEDDASDGGPTKRQSTAATSIPRDAARLRRRVPSGDDENTLEGAPGPPSRTGPGRTATQRRVRMEAMAAGTLDLD
jgi:hypothetical protein